MSSDELNNLRLGDYLKRVNSRGSDEYFMVTQVEEGYRLRQLGHEEVLDFDSMDMLENFEWINTRN
ncbi:MAG: hypothetical protein KU37_02330 [Sulfuricurvum sp. PC08-66]|nr:MAG: hypothetical protein KU37_02330 [Sulfuricurvum sp. PC08-66]